MALEKEPTIDDASITRSSKLRRWFMHLTCILALMWVPIVNGQPFFFFDTTNYIRAADFALHLYSGKKVKTIWTQGYESKEYKPSQEDEKSIKRENRSVHNDISNGVVMSGRSPYFGAILLSSYMISNFWIFVLAQSIVCYILIVLSFRAFNLNEYRSIYVTVMGLAVFTSVAYYNGLLLADAFAAFGLLAFLVILTTRKLSHLETVFLLATIVISVITHLTHIVILASAFVAALLLSLLRWSQSVPRLALLAGLGGLIVGIASVQLTAVATKAAVGREPQLLPLLTARFIADGPGKSYIDSGCEQNRFEICRVKIGDPKDANKILFAKDPRHGAYSLATPAQRTRIGSEDRAFAWAVFKSEPIAQSIMIVKNTLEQLTWVQYAGLNMGCFDSVRCWNNVPEPVRTTLKNSLSGRNLWPERAMDILLKMTIVFSLIILCVFTYRNREERGHEWVAFRTWLLVTGVALLATSAFGGAGVEPQYRYIGRLIWLLPLFAAICLQLRNHQLEKSEVLKVSIQG